MMILGIIGEISAFITCLLFVFYLIGHIWLYRIESKFPTTSLEIDYTHGVNEIDQFDIVADENACEVLLLTSHKNLNSVELYKAVYTGRTFQKQGKIISCVKDIPAGNSIRIKCVVPEGIPSHLLVIKRIDGIIETFAIGYDGRMEGNGVCATSYSITNTLISFMYYLVS